MGTHIDPEYDKAKYGFLRELGQFHESRGSKFKGIPEVNGKEIDVYLLYQIVTSHGGWEKINVRNEWDDLLEHFNLPRSTNGGLILKSIYLKHLELYEKIHYLGEDVDNRHDDEDEYDDFRHRRRYNTSLTKSGTPTVASSTPLHINPIPFTDNNRGQLGMSTRLVEGVDYDRLVLSLQSPLPNDQDMAISVCTLLSNETKHVLKFPKAPRILDLLLAHAGVFNQCKLRELMESSYFESRKLCHNTFWMETISESYARHVLCECFVQKVNQSVGVEEEYVDYYDTDCVDEPEMTEEERGILLLRKRISAVCSGWDRDPQDPATLSEAERFLTNCCSNCPCQGVKSENPSDPFPALNRDSQPLHLVRTSAYSDDRIGQRVTQIANILRNLSFEEDNATVMASNQTLLRFILLSAECSWGTIPQLGLDLLGNVAQHLLLKEPSIDPISCRLLSLIVSGLFSTDRFRILRSLETLREMCKKEGNDEILNQYVKLSVYKRLCELLTISDIMLLIYTLECLLSMTGLGEAVCNELSRVQGSVATLVSLVTVEAQSYGPKGCILMRVVETVTGSLQQGQTCPTTGSGTTTPPQAGASALSASGSAPSNLAVSVSQPGGQTTTNPTTVTASTVTIPRQSHSPGPGSPTPSFSTGALVPVGAASANSATKPNPTHPQQQQPQLSSVTMNGGGGPQQHQQIIKVPSPALSPSLSLSPAPSPGPPPAGPAAHLVIQSPPSQQHQQHPQPHQKLSMNGPNVHIMSNNELFVGSSGSLSPGLNIKQITVSTNNTVYTSLNNPSPRSGGGMVMGYPSLTASTVVAPSSASTTGTVSPGLPVPIIHQNQFQNLQANHPGAVSSGIGTSPAAPSTNFNPNVVVAGISSSGSSQLSSTLNNPIQTQNQFQATSNISSSSPSLTSQQQALGSNQQQQVLIPSISLPLVTPKGTLSEEGWALAWLKGAFEVTPGTSIEQGESYRMYCSARKNPQKTLPIDQFIQCVKCAYGAAVGPVIKQFGSSSLSFFEGIRPKMSLKPMTVTGSQMMSGQPLPNMMGATNVNNAIIAGATNSSVPNPVCYSPAKAPGGLPATPCVAGPGTGPGSPAVNQVVGMALSGMPISVSTSNVSVPIMSSTPNLTAALSPATGASSLTPTNQLPVSVHIPCRGENKTMSPILKATLSRPPKPKNPTGSKGRKVMVVKDKEVVQSQNEGVRKSVAISPTSSAIRSLLASKVAQRQQKKLEEETSSSGKGVGGGGGGKGGKAKKKNLAGKLNGIEGGANLEMQESSASSSINSSEDSETTHRLLSASSIIPITPNNSSMHLTSFQGILRNGLAMDQMDPSRDSQSGVGGDGLGGLTTDELLEGKNKLKGMLIDLLERKVTPRESTTLNGLMGNREIRISDRGLELVDKLGGEENNSNSSSAMSGPIMVTMKTGSSLDSQLGGSDSQSGQSQQMTFYSASAMESSQPAPQQTQAPFIPAPAPVPQQLQYQPQAQYQNQQLQVQAQMQAHAQQQLGIKRHHSIMTTSEDSSSSLPGAGGGQGFGAEPPFKKPNMNNTVVNGTGPGCFSMTMSDGSTTTSTPMFSAQHNSNTTGASSVLQAALSSFASGGGGGGGSGQSSTTTYVSLPSQSSLNPHVIFTTTSTAPASTTNSNANNNANSLPSQQHQQHPTLGKALAGTPLNVNVTPNSNATSINNQQVIQTQTQQQSTSSVVSQSSNPNQMMQLRLSVNPQNQLTFSRQLVLPSGQQLILSTKSQNQLQGQVIISKPHVSSNDQMAKAIIILQQPSQQQQQQQQQGNPTQQQQQQQQQHHQIVHQLQQQQQQQQQVLPHSQAHAMGLQTTTTMTMATLQQQQQQQVQVQQNTIYANATPIIKQQHTLSPDGQGHLGQQGLSSSMPVQIQGAVPQHGGTMEQNPMEYPYLCEWTGCGQRFNKPSKVFLHVTKVHTPESLVDAVRCEWGPNGCDPLLRKRLSLMTHIQDRHCTKHALELSLYRRRNKIEPPPPPQHPTHPHLGYAPNAAFHAIKRHAMQFMNPKELLDDNEGPVTKSIRLTSALILKNLVNYSTLGRKILRGYESQLASIAMSNVESSRTIAQLLYDMKEGNS